MSNELERAKSRLFAALRSRVPSGRIVDTMERVPRELFVRSRDDTSATRMCLFP